MLHSIKLSRSLSILSGVGAVAFFAYKSFDTTRWSFRLPQYEVFSTTRWLSLITSSVQSTQNEENSDTQQQQETEKLTRHYETTLLAADEYHTLLLEFVATKFLETDTLDEMLTDEKLSTTEEQNVANKIKRLALTRFIAAVWCVPLTYFLTRLVFCIYGKSEITARDLRYTIGRVVYLSNAAESIFQTRSMTRSGDAADRPPICDASYQRYLLRAFESHTPDAICRFLTETVSVNRGVHKMNDLCDSRLHRSLRSTWNKCLLIKRRQSLTWVLCCPELIARLNSKSKHEMDSFGNHYLEIVNGDVKYVQDSMKEAHNIVGSRSWHLLVIESVKLIVKGQLPALKEAYMSVLNETKLRQEKTRIKDTQKEPLESDDEEGTVIEADSLVDQQHGVLTGYRGGSFDDNESQASDNSAYDCSHLSYGVCTDSRDARRVSPDLKVLPYTDRSRFVAESSLEPLEFSDVEETLSYDTSRFTQNEASDYEGQRSNEPVKSVPVNFCGSPVLKQSLLKDSENQKKSISLLDPRGIPLIRWSTKLGKIGKEILTQETDIVKDVKRRFAIQNFFLDVFASESVRTLPRCQEKASAIH
eukprot:g4313.t1